MRVHRHVTEAVHQHEGAKIAMQILHAGRYAYHPWLVAPSAIKVSLRALFAWLDAALVIVYSLTVVSVHIYTYTRRPSPASRRAR